MLRAARATARLRTTHGARHASSRLSPEAMDAAIQEMNTEMEELFGSAPTVDPRSGGPPSLAVDDRIKDHRITSRIKDHRIKDHRSVGPPSFSVAEPPIDGFPAAEPALPVPLAARGSLHSTSSSQIERTCSRAQGVLCGKIDALTTQLASVEDAEQSTKLAKSVAACAAALAEMVTLQVATSSVGAARAHEDESVRTKAGELE